MKFRNNKTFDIKSGAYVDYLMSLGIKDVDSFIYKPKPSDIESPWKLKNMQELIDRLHWGFTNNKNFFLQVDSDVDGFTSAAIFYNYFTMLYPEARIDYRVHDGKEHGVIVDTVPVYTDIVVIPDAGSMQIDEQSELNNSDKWVLIMDHHMVEYEDHGAQTIIVNNQTSPEFRNKDLSGAGVVYKVIQAYDEVYGHKIVYKLFSDLAALGIISDLMDVRSLDNNAIIYSGLHNVRNLMFKALLKQQEYSVSSIDTPNKIDIAFYIAPLINATIRSGTSEAKLHLFEGFINNSTEEVITTISQGRERNETIYQFLARSAVNLRGRQNREKEKSLEIIYEKVRKQELNKNKALLVKIGQAEVDKNITGLVAMEINKYYNKPTLILRPVVEGTDIYWRGSGRASNIYGKDGFATVLRQSGYCEFVEGHENAFGASVPEENIEDLTIYLNNYYNDIDFVIASEVDCSMEDSNWNNVMLKEFGEITHIYGAGIPQPKFYFNFTISASEAKVIGQKESTLKINHKGVTFIKFNCRELIEQYYDIVSNGYGIEVEIIGRAEINEYMGYKNVQITVDEMELNPSITKKGRLF